MQLPPTEPVPKESSVAKHVLDERGGLRLVVRPAGAPGIGSLITHAQSEDLISGVEIEPIAHWPDERGSFAELFRFGSEGIARDFLALKEGSVQVSVTTSYPGAIKAIHYHMEQTDLWVPLKGMLQVFLYDLRERAETWGRTNTLFIGDSRPWKLRIPPGVAHGYKVLGTKSGCLLYATNRFYNPADEGRLPYDDPDINYLWQSRPR